MISLCWISHFVSCIVFQVLLNYLSVFSCGLLSVLKTVSNSSSGSLWISISSGLVTGTLLVSFGGVPFAWVFMTHAAVSMLLCLKEQTPLPVFPDWLWQVFTFSCWIPGLMGLPWRSQSSGGCSQITWLLLGPQCSRGWQVHYLGYRWAWVLPDLQWDRTASGTVVKQGWS